MPSRGHEERPACAPLSPAPDAVLLFVTQVVDEIVAAVKGEYTLAQLAERFDAVSAGSAPRSVSRGRAYR